jgi:hypothetical protein
MGFPVENEPMTAAGPIVRSRRQRKPVPIGFVIAILLVIVGGGGGAAGWYFYQDWASKQLVGELPAVEMDYAELKPVLIDRNVIEIPDADRRELLKELAKIPLPMISDLMQVQFRGDPEGLMVSIARGAKSMWYRVETRKLPVLADYIDHDTEPLRSRRADALSRAATEFLQQFQAVTAHKAGEDAILPYRDKLGLLALQRRLGTEAVVVVGQNMYPCAYEEPDGTLYFLLPPKTKEFELRGRTSETGGVRFTGRFTVKVKSRKVDHAKPPPDLRRAPVSEEVQG